MDVTPLIKEGAQIVQSYADGSFRVSGEVYDHPLLVYPEKSVRWNFDSGVDDLGLSSFDDVPEYADGQVDVILLGTGASMKMLPAKLRNGLRDKGLSIDCMDTGAACRTYNVLMAEGRRVVAALLPAK